MHADPKIGSEKKRSKTQSRETKVFQRNYFKINLMNIIVKEF